MGLVCLMTFASLTLPEGSQVREAYHKSIITVLQVGHLFVMCYNKEKV